MRSVRDMFHDIFGDKPRLQEKNVDGFFKTLTAYAPVFSTWDGQLYESELIRAAVDAKARHISKLVVDIKGTAKPKLRSALRPGPNDWMTWSQFLYRTSVILDMQTNVWIVPVLDDDLNTVGYFPVLPDQVSIIEAEGELWLKYRFRSGETGYMEMRRCRWMTKFQYDDDLFGAGNGALRQTMDLLNMQNQGIKEGIKNSATFRFMAKASNFADPKDLAKEMKRFNKQNLRGESGGILLFPTEYDNIQQIRQEPYNLNADQLKIIQTNVFNYFGVNEDVIQNKAVGDKWAAFYDGALEPFAVQLSEVLTRMTFTQREIAAGNMVTVTANRLQYASTQEKLNVSSQMADRGIMNRNEIREIWGLPPIEGSAGEMYLVRGEYKDANAEENVMAGVDPINTWNEGGGNDAET